METAHVLDCGRLIVQAGWEYETAAKGITRDQHRCTFIDTMQKQGTLRLSKNRACNRAFKFTGRSSGISFVYFERSF